MISLERGFFNAADAAYIAPKMAQFMANELQKAVLGPLKQANKLDQIVQDLASRKTDPYSTVKEVLKEVLK